MIHKISLLFAVIVMLLFSCESSGDDKLVIAVTTDVHGSVFSDDLVTGTENRTSMAKVSGYLKSLDPSNLILLDNGDNLQGSPSVYYYNFEEISSDHIWPGVLNYLGYDAVTVGNHDIEAGHDVYDRIRNQFNFPMLAANAVNISDGSPYFEPYTIIKKSGYRIAVLGLITPAVPGWLPEILYEGIEFTDMVETAKKWMPEILKQKPDLVIGLFHAGWDETYGGGSADSFMNGNASLAVAKKVPGFDIVFIGHDHDLMNDYVLNSAGDSVLILDGGSHARYVARADITFTKNGKEITGSLVKTDTVEPDVDFIRYFNSDYEDVVKYVSRKIGNLDKPMSVRDAYFGDSPFIDLIHRVQLDVSGAQISFAAPLSFDVEIPGGKLMISDMFELYRYENMLYTISLTGEEIDKYLEYSGSLWFNSQNEATKPLLKFREGNSNRLMNRYYNFDSAAGIEYTVDITKSEGEMVNITSLSDGTSFYPDSAYTVAVNSYRGSGGGGHLTRGTGLDENDMESRLISSTDKDLRYYMIKWIEEEKVIKTYCDNNWKIIPESFVKTRIKVESEQLFRKD